MKALVKTAVGKGNLAYVDCPVPVCGENDVKIRVEAAAICGTDLHIEHWNEWAAKRVNPPCIIGHEFAGHVVERGAGVTSVAVGDLVSAETHIVCDSCALCHNDNRHVCPNTKTIGVSRDGCFAEYIVIPAKNAFVCDPDLPVQIAAILEPYGVAVHAATEFPLVGKTVAVAGAGAIGLMCIAIAKKQGAAAVFSVEPNAARGKLALDLGADAWIDPLHEDAVARIRALTGGLGVEVAIDITGNIPALRAALGYLRPAGQFAAVGLPSEPITFDFSEFVYRGIQLHGIAGRRMFGDWERGRGLLAGGLDLSPIVTHVLPMSEWRQGFDLMEQGLCAKVVLTP